MTIGSVLTIMGHPSPRRKDRNRVTSCSPDLASSPYEARAAADARPVLQPQALHVLVLQRSARSMSGLASPSSPRAPVACMPLSPHD